MTAPALVATAPVLAPTYRALDGSGRVAGYAETHSCPPCHGRGRSYSERHRACGACGGSGRLLGEKPNQTWPVAVELIET